jgi:heme O synthase-like polyprenyltransferase
MVLSDDYEKAGFFMLPTAKTKTGVTDYFTCLVDFGFTSSLLSLGVYLL